MPVTRIELSAEQGQYRVKKMLQQESGEVMEPEDGSVEFETPTDDEEVTIPSQDKHKKVPDIPNSDIRDEQTLSNTQREDWLLPTEPMHGARPRQTGSAVRNLSQTFLLSPGSPVDTLVVTRSRADVFVIWEQNVDYVKCYK